MNFSPTSSPGSTSTPSSLSSSASASTLHPNNASSSTLRRRSVDTGGLNLVVNDHIGSGSGRGYGGWVEPEVESSSSGPLDVANLLMALREETNNIIDQAHPRTNTTHPSASNTNPLKEKYIRDLASWDFDASHLPLDEVLLCTTILFELLWAIEGMEMAIGLTFDILPSFLARVSKIYREGSSYHNFQHALDVLQATYFYLQAEECVPNILCLLDIEQVSSVELGSKGRASNSTELWTRPQVSLLQRALRNEDLFALFIAAIGHDIGHPGVSNAFLKNAKTPLAELFSDDSVLEKMHCTLLLQTMRKHGMSHLLDSSPGPNAYLHSTPHTRYRTDSDPGVQTNGVYVHVNGHSDADGYSMPSPSSSKLTLKKRASVYPFPSETVGTSTDFRALLVKTILATDMSVHGQWMALLSEFNEQQRKWETCKRPGSIEMPVDSQTRLLLCQALLKCADISNPSRPPPACEHWSTSLITEWMEQAFLERKFELPISVSTSKDPRTTAQGQIGFIKACTLPLLEATALSIPKMIIFRDQCHTNLIMWQLKIDDIDAIAASIDKSVVEVTSEYGSQLSLPISPPDMTTMFALSLPAVVYTPSFEYRHSPWPACDTSASSLNEMTEECFDVASVVVRTNGIVHSEPSSPIVDSDLQLFHRRQPSHTELPQVSIPRERSASSSCQPIKSGSTMSSSPLFSPRSIATSSSSPRSDSCSPGPGLSATTSTTSHSREILRAVYEAHGRSKTKRWEHRASWHSPIVYNLNSMPPSLGSAPLLDSSVPQETPSGS